jgi:hypothetical protein
VLCCAARYTIVVDNHEQGLRDEQHWLLSNIVEGQPCARDMLLLVAMQCMFPVLLGAAEKPQHVELAYRCAQLHGCWHACACVSEPSGTTMILCLLGMHDAVGSCCKAHCCKQYPGAKGAWIALAENRLKFDAMVHLPQ